MSRIRNAWRALFGAEPEVAYIPVPDGFVEAYEARVYKRAGFGPYRVFFGSCCEAHKRSIAEVNKVALLKVDGELYQPTRDLRLYKVTLEDGKE